MTIVTPFHVCVVSSIPCHIDAKENPTSVGRLFIENPIVLAIQNGIFWLDPTPVAAVFAPA